jgi:predicted PurR-regulated permease PerM
MGTIAIIFFALFLFTVFGIWFNSLSTEISNLHGDLNRYLDRIETLLNKIHDQNLNLDLNNSLDRIENLLEDISLSPIK